jgi:hypothetical protein
MKRWMTEGNGDFGTEADPAEDREIQARVLLAYADAIVTLQPIDASLRSGIRKDADNVRSGKLTLVPPRERAT